MDRVLNDRKYIGEVVEMVMQKEKKFGKVNEDDLWFGS